jgi:heterodisulfide reductase subunit C
MTVEFAGCLQCGTCMIACVYGSVKWKYPKADLVSSIGLDDGNYINLQPRSGVHSLPA